MTKTDIEWLEYANQFHYGNHPEINTAVKHAIEALERTRWIPVSERLPEYGGYVLAVFEKCLPFVAMYYSGVKKFSCEREEANPTHWMPLPGAPEMTREEAGHWDGIAPEEIE